VYEDVERWCMKTQTIVVCTNVSKYILICFCVYVCVCVYMFALSARFDVL